MELDVMTIAASLILATVLAFACGVAWLALSGKATDIRKALLYRHTENLKQLSNIVELSLEANRVSAAEALEARIDPDPVNRFVAVIRNARTELENSSTWKVLHSCPRHWYLAETHTRYYAPLEGQLRDTIDAIREMSAP